MGAVSGSTGSSSRELEAKVAKLEAEVAALRSQDRRAVVKADSGWDD